MHEELKQLKPKILKDAAYLVSKGWCHGSYARDGNGDSVEFTSDDACMFCAMGAIQKASFSAVSDMTDAWQVCEFCLHELFKHLRLHKISSEAITIAKWNDSSNQEEVASKLLGAATS